MTRAWTWACAVAVGGTAGFITFRGEGDPADPAGTQVKAARCVPCATHDPVFCDETLFSIEVNRFHQWLRRDLPVQPEWSVTDVARLLKIIRERSDSPDPVAKYQDGLVRAWAILTTGDRLAREAPTVSGCEFLLRNAVVEAIQDPDPRIRYSAASALIALDGTPPEAAVVAAHDPDEGVASLVRWRLWHAAPHRDPKRERESAR